MVAQSPQCVASLARSTQLVSHWVREALHCAVHSPRSHTSPVAQVTPHAPQSVVLVSVLTHPELGQSTSPGPHCVVAPAPAVPPVVVVTPPAPPVDPPTALPPIPTAPPSPESGIAMSPMSLPPQRTSRAGEQTSATARRRSLMPL